ncbi:nucleotidyltransferase domain-containing protein [Candidatus Babeliales bacterium]|nr:nucleotidyltransferase domain-containing protein [Candidatus Babeliales bacterium]
MKESINPEYKEMILRALEYHFPGARVYLFGSRATLTHKEGADVDLAVDAGTKILPAEMLRARVTLEHLRMPLMTDLVDMNAIVSELKEEILKNGVVWKS